MLGQRKGQSTLEYAIVIGVVVAALIALNLYMQRGVQGKLKESTDQVGRQFEPTNFSLGWTTTASGNTITKETRNNTTGGTTTSEITDAEQITRDETTTWGDETTD